MYALNDHLGKAQRRLRYAASAEVNASHPNAPAQYHNTWQHLLEERPRPSRSYGFTGSVNEARYPSESWEDGGNYLLRGHRHSISTLRNNGLVGLPSRLPSESRYVHLLSSLTTAANGKAQFHDKSIQASMTSRMPARSWHQAQTSSTLAARRYGTLTEPEAIKTGWSIVSQIGHSMTWILHRGINLLSLDTNHH